MFGGSSSGGSSRWGRRCSELLLLLLLLLLLRVEMTRAVGLELEQGGVEVLQGILVRTAKLAVVAGERVTLVHQGADLVDVVVGVPLRRGFASRGSGRGRMLLLLLLLLARHGVGREGRASGARRSGALLQLHGARIRWLRLEGHGAVVLRRLLHCQRRLAFALDRHGVGGRSIERARAGDERHGGRAISQRRQSASGSSSAGGGGSRGSR